jgi:hypothetical protein
MKNSVVFPLLLLVLSPFMLLSCGIKPAELQPPSVQENGQKVGQEENAERVFPSTYPQKATIHE